MKVTDFHYHLTENFHVLVMGFLHMLVNNVNQDRPRAREYLVNCLRDLGYSSEPLPNKRKQWDVSWISGGEPLDEYTRLRFSVDPREHDHITPIKPSLHKEAYWVCNAVHFDDMDHAWVTLLLLAYANQWSKGTGYEETTRSLFLCALAYFEYRLRAKQGKKIPDIFEHHGEYPAYTEYVVDNLDDVAPFANVIDEIIVSTESGYTIDLYFNKNAVDKRAVETGAIPWPSACVCISDSPKGYIDLVVGEHFPADPSGISLPDVGYDSLKEGVEKTLAMFNPKNLDDRVHMYGLLHQIGHLRGALVYPDPEMIYGAEVLGNEQQWMIRVYVYRPELADPQVRELRELTDDDEQDPSAPEDVEVTNLREQLKKTQDQLFAKELENKELRQELDYHYINANTDEQYDTIRVTVSAPANVPKTYIVNRIRKVLFDDEQDFNVLTPVLDYPGLKPKTYAVPNVHSNIIITEEDD